MGKIKVTAFTQTFNVEEIIEMLAAYPKRDYALIAQVASMLFTEHTTDLSNLGSDLTWKDKNQILGRVPRNDRDLVKHIESLGENSPAYQFAVERRISQTTKKVVRGVKKRHDEDDRAIINDSLKVYKQPIFFTWKNRNLSDLEESDSVDSVDSVDSSVPDNSDFYLENEEYNSTDYLEKVIEENQYSESNDFDDDSDECDLPW